MPTKYVIVAVQPEDKLPADPPEKWEQKGNTYPEGKPPAGVCSPNVAIPEFRQLNFVPAEPLPAPPAAEQPTHAPEAKPAASEHRDKSR